MKKYLQISSLLLLFISQLSWAETLPTDYYYVASDLKNDSVPKGKCLVRGRAWEPYSEMGVPKGIISNLSRTAFTYTDDQGNFELLISSKDTAIFFYHPKYKELVCWNYHFKSQHVVTMNFVTSEKLPEGVIQVQEKPVIYLYPEEQIDFKVQLDSKIDLISSYPVYHDGWSGTVSPAGTIEIGARSYPYLFWEGTASNIAFEKDGNTLIGHCISTDTTISFLENQLSAMGLNDREATDFITYWGPRIQQYPYATIQFWTNDAVDERIGNLMITPKPDQLIRLYMLFEGSDHLEPIVISPGNYPIAKREGFVVLEWGGTEIKRTVQP